LTEEGFTKTTGNRPLRLCPNLVVIGEKGREQAYFAEEQRRVKRRGEIAKDWRKSAGMLKQSLLP